MSDSRSIILIGPSKTGKTTLSKRLSELMQIPEIQLDEIRWDYYKEIGYDANKAKAIRKEGGMEALAKHWKPYDIHAVESVLRDYLYGYIISFGAGHSVYDDPEQIQRAKVAFEPFPHVFFIVPSLNVDESYAILRQRLADDEGFPDEVLDGLMKVNRTFINHPCNLLLARHTILNANKTVDETCSEIMALM